LQIKLKKDDLVQMRRKALRDGDENLYKDIIQDMVQEEEIIYSSLLEEAVVLTGMQDEQFMISQDKYMS
jgi:hypothetical protein